LAIAFNESARGYRTLEVFRNVSSLETVWGSVENKTIKMAAETNFRMIDPFQL